MTKVNDIREAYFRKGETISGISVRFSVDRKTVRKYVMEDNFNAPVPTEKGKPQRSHPKLDLYKETIDEWLESDKKARKKQRHTAKRVYDRLVEAHDDFGCSYRTVASYVKEKKKTIYGKEDGALPLIHKAGEAQVDFGSADFYENGTLFSGKYLNVSFPYSNAGYVQLFKGENQECLFHGLRNIFERLGGVPSRLWFDNASTVVSGILKGGNRNLTEGFLRFKQHYGFDSVFCNPASGNEKGNVENKVGYHRRNLFVPIPELKSLDEYNLKLLERSEEDHQRPHYRQGVTIDQLHLQDRDNLTPLPNVPFDCNRYERLRADGYGKLSIGPCHRYSTSPKFASSSVLVCITHDKVIPMDESNRPITTHRRLYGQEKQESMDWLPYLTQLSRRPGALKYSGIYDMLPEPLKEYMEPLDKGQRGSVLRVIENLTVKNGFEKAVTSIAEALERGIEDLDSLITLHDYLSQGETRDRMNLEGISLPVLPELNFSSESYDSMLLSRSCRKGH